MAGGLADGSDAGIFAVPNRAGRKPLGGQRLGNRELGCLVAATGGRAFSRVRSVREPSRVARGRKVGGLGAALPPKKCNKKCNKQKRTHALTQSGPSVSSERVTGVV
jgi:hypothetical protein